MKAHPMQPIEQVGGIFRFKKNRIVEHLLDDGPFDMNSIAIKDFSREDREQFAQLIGYSLSGYSELSYVSDESFGVASMMAHSKISETQARQEYLAAKLNTVAQLVKRLTEELFRIHPDDLEPSINERTQGDE